MSIIQKFVTLVRGTGNEIGQAVVDRNAITIVEQELRDADSALIAARNALVTQKAQRKVLSDKVDAKKARLKELESLMPQLVKGTDEKLALDTATRISEFENEIGGDAAVLTSMDKTIDDLNRSIQTGDKAIEALKRRKDALKATEQVQRAQVSVSAVASGSSAKLRTAMDSLDRMDERQKLRAAELDAASETASASGDGGLDARLKAAGVIPGETAASDVLARYKNVS
jgi:phage shock protein A